MNEQIRLRIMVLISNILDNELNHYRNKCPENITDLVFLEIQNNQKLLEEYRSIGKKIGFILANQYIGKLIKNYWNLENLGRYSNPQSKLIDSYEKHGN